MNNKDLMNALTDIDADLLAHAEKTPSPVPLWVRVCAAAACLCLLIGTTLALIPNHSGDSPTVPSRIPAPLVNANIAPEKLTGSSLEFIVGNSAENNTIQSSPPAFRFGPSGFMVQAEVVSVLPDTYFNLANDSKFKPLAYKLIRMQVQTVLNGEGIPEQFLYMLPESMLADLTVYDCLLICMTQVGTEGHLLRNSTKNQIECFSEPIFGNREFVMYSIRRNGVELGNMIAFSDGIFDESLWQNPGWGWGYQFANWNDTSLVVQHGSTLEQVKERIRERIYGTTPTVTVLHFHSREAQDAYEYVKPFANGVFAQELDHYGVTYRRYINGCPTEETIRIRFEDEKVTYSTVRYTQEDLATISDISITLSDLTRLYTQNTPVPPHTDPTGKRLKTLNLFAWYAKAGGRVYGVVKTVWLYSETVESPQYGKKTRMHYDDSYRIFDDTDESGRLIPRDELLMIFDSNHIYKDEYGIGETMPM